MALMEKVLAQAPQSDGAQHEVGGGGAEVQRINGGKHRAPC